MSEIEIEYIAEHRSDIIKISNGMRTTVEVMQWLQKTYPRDCWTCPCKARMNARNLITRYDKQRNIQHA